jgi:hypothetical protein
MASNIDALIAQGPRPPEVDPNGIANRIITLRQAMQGQQLQQEQIEAARQENQQRAIQLDQTRALNAAYQAALTTDANGTPTIDRDTLTHALAQAGHGSAIPGIIKSINDLDKSHADLQEAKGKVAVQENDYAGSIGAAVKAANGDPQLFMTLATNAVRQQHVDPNVVKPLMDQVSAALQQDPTGAAARQLTSRIADHMISLSPTQQQRQTEATTANARMVTAQTGQDKFDLEKPGLEAKAKTDAAVGAATLANPKLFTPDQQRQSDQAAATLAQTKTRDAQTAANQNTRNAIAGGELNLGQKKFDATLGAGLDANGKPLSDDELKQVAMKDPVAVAIANYQAPDANTRTALGQATMRKVYAIDRGHDGTQFPARNKVAQDFSPAGASGKTITSIDTALAHLDAISRAGEALKNNDIVGLNRIANALGYQFGGSARNVYDGIVSMVAPEVTKAVIGEAGGEGERQAMARNFSSSVNTATREATLGQTAQLFGARFGKMAHAYESQMGKPMERQLSPESQAVLQRYSGGAQQQTGQTPPLPPKLTQGDVGKTYMSPKTGKPIKIMAVNPQDGTQFRSQQVQ